MAPEEEEIKEWAEDEAEVETEVGWGKVVE